MLKEDIQPRSNGLLKRGDPLDTVFYFNTNDKKAQGLFFSAEKFYELGFTPIPCLPRSKKPVCEWARWQHRRPSWDELAQVWQEALQRFEENLNIATLLGEAHGLCAIDIDNPELFKQACQAVGLTAEDLRTWATKSHRGGALIFRYPAGYDLPSKISNPNWGAELLGNERILMLPPSIHPEGTPYSWRFPPDQVEIADIPEVLLEAFDVKPKSQAPTNEHSLPAWASSLIQLLKPFWQEGYRHDIALSLSGLLAKRGVDKHTATAVINKLAQESADNEIRDRLRALVDTYERLADNESILAWHGLERILDEPTLKAIDALIPNTNGNGKSPISVDFETIQRPKNPTTDLGNAERLVRLFGDRIRFVPQWGWLVWDGRRWKRDVGNQQVIKFAEETVRAIYKEAAEATDKAERERLAKWAIVSENKQRISAMIDLASPMCLADASEFDQDPYLLNCLNGVVDLHTGELKPHDPSLRLTKLAPVNYNPHAKAPVWEKFLNDVFCDDIELISYIQRALGYSLTGDVCEDVMFIAWGSGSNGKTTLFNAVMSVLGDYAKMIAPDALLKRNQQSDSHPTSIADLCGVRLAIAQETEEGRYLAAARVKALTGKDRVKARFMRKDYFEFDPTHKIWLATNHKPIINDTTFAMWRRIQLIPFLAVFDETRRDKRMLEKLLAEKEGILAWLVKGCLEWQQDGLKPPTIVIQMTKEYQTEMDKVQSWLEACCIVDPKEKTEFAKLYASYQTWCQENDEEPLSKRSFGNKLTEKGFVSDTKREGGRVVKVRKGLRLKDNDSGSSDDGLLPSCYRVTDVTDISALTANIGTQEVKYQNYGNMGNIGNITQSVTQPETDPEKPDNPLTQMDNFVDTEAWLKENIGFADQKCPQCGEPLSWENDHAVCVGCGRLFHKMVEGLAAFKEWDEFSFPFY